MHFALPPRKTSNPPPYAPRSASGPWSIRRNARMQSLAVVALAAIGIVWLLIHILGGQRGSTYIPAGTPKAVVVTVFDEHASESFKASIVENRKDYASRHGYTTFFSNTSAYSLSTQNTPKTWSILPALRHAMALHPHSPYLFHLAPTALIMAPLLSLEQHILSAPRLDSLMQKDRPIVPPDSVIHTFSHLKAANIDLVLTQDDQGLAQSSLVLRTGEWAKYLLDAWFDPLYQSYNFQKAERHALEHIVQWHGTVLARLAVIPQRTMNSYVSAPSAQGTYAEGDFVANFEGCQSRVVPDEPEDDKDYRGRKKKEKIVRTTDECEAEMAAMLGRWREMVDKEGRGRQA